MPITIGGSLSFCGQQLSADDLQLIRDLVHDFKSLSLTQLASTICELLDWRRPNGSLKTRECFSFLQELVNRGWVQGLPDLRVTSPKGARSIKVDQASQPQPQLSGSLQELLPLDLQLITDRADRRLFQQYLHRYHYLGYRVPVGAQLRYFVRRQQGDIVACLLFTSGAWKMAPRDQWIGWDDLRRRANLSLVVSQSRFLILPWVHIPTLASHILSMSARQLPHDWQSHYGLRPVLLETLVDQARFRGVCYRAANWIQLGSTQGRGRMDRFALAQGSPKLIFVYPLTKHARRQLCQSSKGDHYEPSRDL
jgi:hypothetical protein